MHKLYFITLSLISVITATFLLFCRDENFVNRRFLASFGIEVSRHPYLIEELRLPKEFDEMYNAYNFIQIQSGLDLSGHKGKPAVRFTYEILNTPSDFDGTVYANVICINRKPIAGDITCPSLNGFVEPLVYFSHMSEVK